MATPVRVRFAPSPTGFLHIGGLRTALYNWLFARRHGGTFILRIEDTDRTRLVEGATESLQKTLEMVGLTPDEGPFLQSERKEGHLAYAQQLIEMGKAYYCFCTKERLEQVAEEQRAAKRPMMYDGHCRGLSQEEVKVRQQESGASVIRLAVPKEGTIVMEDMIHGRIEVPWAQVDDQVLIKSDGFPTYHLAATCDDHDMEISHVIRGDEWISSLPKHLFIYEAFGWKAPEYAHLPLLLNADRSKLSKRQGDVAVEDYLKKGYLPEALVNFVALLGWNPTADREIFTKEELAELFDITKVNKSGAVLNVEKLDWLNAHYIKQMTDEAFLEACKPFLSADVADEVVRRACLLSRDRLTNFASLQEVIEPVIHPNDGYEAAELCWKTQPVEQAKERLEGINALLSDKAEGWFDERAHIEDDLRAFIADKGWSNGDTLWPLRVALSGQKQSPSPFELLWAYGKERSLARVKQALEKLK